MEVTVRKTTDELQKGFLVVATIIVTVFPFFLTWHWFWHEALLTQNAHVRYNVLIFAPARSGSSFLGEMLNQHEEVFYLYEPLHTYSILNKLGVLKQQQLQHDSLTLLHDAYQCNFTNHRMYLYFISHQGFSPAHFRSSSRALSTWPLCFSRENKTYLDSWNQASKPRHKCENRLEPGPTSIVCHRRKQVVIKELSDRLSLPTVIRHFNRTEKIRLKFLHLVRDPRAIVTSRIRLGWISWDSDGPVKIRELCHRMTENIFTVKNMSLDTPGKYLVLRYEDLAQKVLPTVKRLFKEAGLEMTESVEQWILRNTRWSHLTPHNSTYAFKTEERDAVKTISSWRRSISMDVVRSVEEKCDAFMKEAGYRKIIDKNDLDGNSSLLVKPSKSVGRLFVI